MAIERKFCDYGGHPLEYTMEVYTNADGMEMVRIVVVSGKAYIMYMITPESLDGRYDVVNEGGTFEIERKNFIDVTSDGLSAKEFLAVLDDMGAYAIYYKDYFDKI